MKAYQEAYLKNLQQALDLTDLSAGVPEDIRLFIEERRSRTEMVRALVAENTALLRENLFPELDDIATADEADAGGVCCAAPSRREAAGRGAGLYDPQRAAGLCPPVE